jgi:hypothetical protein
MGKEVQAQHAGEVGEGPAGIQERWNSYLRSSMAIKAVQTNGSISGFAVQHISPLPAVSMLARATFGESLINV